ncbi:hypothetical protein ACH5RR_026027 [Cinchona calisaya]|uniref:Uncharacterized protein n=1 Tax=Cinchona calisaya TaxID=153742 RepID=A0ABD2Z4Q1_9GENT
MAGQYRAMLDQQLFALAPQLMELDSWSLACNSGSTTRTSSIASAGGGITATPFPEGLPLQLLLFEFVIAPQL